MSNTIGICGKCQQVTGVHPDEAFISICNECDRTATIHYCNIAGSVKISLSDKPNEPLWFEGCHYEQALNDALLGLAAQGYNFDDRTGFEAVSGIFNK